MPELLQGLGGTMLVGCSIYWMATGHQSVMLIGGSISMIAVGAYQALLRAMRDR